MPGGIVCSIASCKNNSKLNDEFKYFTFPKDPVIQKQWIHKCKRKDKFDCKYKRICSKHFKPGDYEDEMQSRLMGTHPRKLKKTALSSLYLTSNQLNEPNKLSNRAERAQTKERKLLVENIIMTQATTEVHSLTQEEHTKNDEIASASDMNEHITMLNKMEKENIELKNKVLQYEKSEYELKEKVLKLEKQITETRSNFENKVKNALKDFLTPNQVDIVLKKKSKVRWNQEELGIAFTLRYFSKRCYIYLRQTLHFPLPGLSTLQHWAANINLRSGLLLDVLRVMEIAGTTKTSLQKITVLSFDDMKVSSMYEYDKKHDDIVGPHSYMQVIMARGLFEKWKQPVLIAFDQKSTKDIINNVISRLHEINYNVVACMSDCGGGNMGLWRQMNINIDNTFTMHPVTDKPIYFFADAPHLLKLLRNWFIDTGFTLSDGTLINKTLVQKLLENSNTEISSCYKLSSLHLQCEKAQRQNVKLAAQLFSHTTSTALKHYLPGDDKNLALNVGNFMQLVSNWFDILNSYTPSAKIPTKKPYGLNYSAQNDILDKMISTVKNMRCTGKSALQIFQKGIIISTISIQNLYKFFQNEYNVTYILTHRLNQDCLENFFSQLRTRGGLHDHPAPLNALYRIRMILLGKDPGLVQTHTNTQMPDEQNNDNYIFTNVLNKAKLHNIKIMGRTVRNC